ncbi:MAG: ParB/RepB/Spo0J family partition protein [Eubacterium sp.]|nr:ParB/RepB/Spo0J family partition protein [Eubacterium sp.]
MRNLSSVKLQSYEDIFGEETSDIRELPLEKLLPFPNHPYLVLDNDELAQLAESIRKNGVLHPLSVIAAGGDAYYIISGHRRMAAAGKAGLTTLPCMIREISMDQAIVEMVDANLYREQILPSEKARAYAMKRDALRRLREENPDYVEKGKRTAEALSEEVGDSKATIHRYLRLNELIPEFLSMVDDCRMLMSTAVELSYLSKEEQQIVCAVSSERGRPVKPDEAQELRTVSESEPITEGKAVGILLLPVNENPQKKKTTQSAKELTRQTMQGYVLAACDSLGLSQDIINELQEELDNLVVTMSGREAREYLEQRSQQMMLTVSQ